MITVILYLYLYPIYPIAIGWLSRDNKQHGVVSLIGKFVQQRRR